TVHVSAQLRTAAYASAVAIVPWRPKTAHHRHVLNRDAGLLEIRDYQLELVDEILVEDEVLGPHVLLIVREEVAEAEMLGDLHVLILRCHLDEPVGILIRVGKEAPSALTRPETNAVQTDAAVLLVREGPQCDEGERLREEAVWEGVQPWSRGRRVAD